MPEEAHQSEASPVLVASRHQLSPRAAAPSLAESQETQPADSSIPSMFSRGS